MLIYSNSRVISFFLILFFLLIAGYSYFEIRNILYGPTIAITAPNNAATVSEPLIMVRGKTKHIKSLFLNGRTIPVTSEGIFEELVVLSPGYNEIVLSANDTMKRGTKQVLAIVYSPVQNGEDVEEFEKFEEMATSTTEE